MKDNRTALIVVLTLLIGLSFLATNLLSYFVAHDSLSTQISENALPLTSDNVYSEIQRDLVRPVFISSLMANDTFVRDWIIDGENDESKIIKYLQETQSRYDAVTAFLVSEKTKKYYHPTGILKTVTPEDPQDSWYFRVKELSHDYEVNIDVDTSDNQSITIFINYRVYDYDSRYIGTVGVGLGLDIVKQMIESYQKRYGRRIYFIDRKGQVALHGESFFGSSNIRQKAGLGALADQILSSPNGSYTYSSGTKTVFLNSRFIPDFNWYLIVEQDELPLEEKIKNTLLGNLVLAVGITIIILIGANIILSGYQRRLNEMATTDKLTGMLNRQAFDTVFTSMIDISERRKEALSLVIFDIDHLKAINDTYGHLAGDEVIKQAANSARTCIRKSDLVCRWGGEEFIVLLPECPFDEARELADKIRRHLENQTVPFGDKKLKTTASFGVAQQATGETRESLIHRADQALLAAKHTGRNRVEPLSFVQR